MLNALRLKAGLHAAAVQRAHRLAADVHPARQLEEAERKGLLARDLFRVWPTERGLDFLSDLQTLFLPDADKMRE
jgi:coproporphyrinogen III oxidase-like Fe-S oxidoreductase